MDRLGQRSVRPQQVLQKKGGPLGVFSGETVGDVYIWGVLGGLGLFLGFQLCHRFSLPGLSRLRAPLPYQWFFPLWVWGFLGGGGGLV